MSEEGKIDLSSFDSISDRVTRAKAKAEAIRQAKAAAGGGASPSRPAKPPAEGKTPSTPEAVSAAIPTEETPVAAAPEAPPPPSEPAPAQRKVPPARRAAPAAAPEAAPAGPAGISEMSTVEKAAATRRERAAALSRAAIASKTAEPAEAALSRRGFFSWLAVAWVAFAAAAAAGGAAMTRFLFPNVLFEPPQTFKAGLPEDYDIGKVDERWKEKFAVWLVRSDRGMYALSTVCTHLGCTPNWLEGENKFKCPCHGSGYYRTGVNFEGPAPRPLERFRIALADDGQILVDKTKKYQFEKGQWDDPESFLKLS